MEIRKLLLITIAWTLCQVLFVCHTLQAQPAVKVYTIKNGNMHIALSKSLSKAEIDTFKIKFDLGDLPIFQSIHGKCCDSIEKLGWTVLVNDEKLFIIGKPLESFKGMGDVAGKIIYTQKKPSNEEMFPAQGEGLIFGSNRFNSAKYPFAVNQSDVTFFLKGNLKAGRVMLAGSFNDWNPDKLPMKKTDSGWVATVKLNMTGKYWYKYIVDGNWTIDKDNMLKEDDGFGNTNSVFYMPNYTFTLEGYTNAKNVYLSGNFNSWRKNELPMLRTANGWKLSVYLAEGTHLYKYVADGSWITDPKNFNKLPDGGNGFNSVVSMGAPYVFKLNGYVNAGKVLLTGTFNNWNESELAMKKTATGWELPYILRGGNYEYKFIVDGNWITDPGNPATIENEKGSKNSFLIINPNFTFRLKGYPNAKRVLVAGDFNNWNGNSLIMKREGDEWVFQLHLSPGKHKYKFLVDGTWITDPGNKLYEQNEYGTGNSFIWVSR